MARTRTVPTQRRNWRLRDEVWLRDGGVCVDCPPGTGPWPWQGWQADHVIELADGGADELHNAVTRCNSHHRAKTAAARRARARGRVLTGQPTLFPELTLPLSIPRAGRPRRYPRVRG